MTSAPSEFREEVAARTVARLRQCEPVLAVWEGGSAANASSDAYSDLDLNLLVRGPHEPVFAQVEAALGPLSHVWHEPRSIWPTLTQKVYFLEGAPRHFFVDVAAFPEDGDVVSEFMQVERHGTPVVHFDRTGRLVPRRADGAALRARQRQRLAEVVAAFPVYRTETLKELDRGHAVDAFAFYQSGMLRPLVEVLGMVHRPFRFDFGLRYLSRDFPADLHARLERLLLVPDLEALRGNAAEVERMFDEATRAVSARWSEP